MSGEGDGDAAIFVFGMIVGAALAHNWGLASSPAGIEPHGMAAVAVCLVVCLIVCLFVCLSGCFVCLCVRMSGYFLSVCLNV